MRFIVRTTTLLRWPFQVKVCNFFKLYPTESFYHDQLWLPLTESHGTPNMTCWPLLSNSGLVQVLFLFTGSSLNGFALENKVFATALIYLSIPKAGPDPVPCVYLHTITTLDAQPLFSLHQSSWSPRSDAVIRIAIWFQQDIRTSTTTKATSILWTSHTLPSRRRLIPTRAPG